MSSKKLFASQPGPILQKTDAVNEAGGKAYSFSSKHALAQYCMTGCLADSYYITGEMQLEKILSLAKEVEPEFLAELAVYARKNGYMKDTPALLLAVLTSLQENKNWPGLPYLVKVFDRVIDNGRMLRNYVQIVRSGVTGRKSFGTVAKKLIDIWLRKASDKMLIEASVGNDPSLANIVKMIHPKPLDETRNAFYGWLLGKQFDQTSLPEDLSYFEEFKKSKEGRLPRVPFQMLTALELKPEHWAQIAVSGGWHMVRMNLNTFLRHGVLKDPEVVNVIAEKLRDTEVIRKVKVFPYQLLSAYLNVSGEMPIAITEALQDALDISLSNIPEYKGTIVVCPDVSGSMSSPITGSRGSASSKVRCIDVAALIAAAILRKSPTASVIPFEMDVVNVRLNPRDSIMTNANKLAGIGGGGTNCSAPLISLLQKKIYPDLVIYASDNESWVDSQRYRSTETLVHWNMIRKNNPKAKLVCIDITSGSSTQAYDRKDILNIGGFNDQVFDIINLFVNDQLNGSYWTDVIEKSVIL